VEKALARDPAQRYADAAQMRDALGPVYRLYHGEIPPYKAVSEYLRLGRFTSGEFKALIPEETPWPRRLVWLAPLLLAALAAAGYFAWDLRPKPQMPAGDFAGLLEQGKMEEALRVFPEDPAARQEACFALAQAHWKGRDAAQALLWADKAQDAGFHPRVAALRAEIYLEEGLRARSHEELKRMRPFLRRAGVETRVQYHWLRVRWLRSSPSPLTDTEKKELRWNLEAVLRLVGHPSDPRRLEAQSLLSEIH
jgi:TPR repeat protein